MIKAEYIIHNSKTLLTIIFNISVLKHLNTKCDDYLNFFQSTNCSDRITLFKSDTGYRIIRHPHEKKTYKIYIRQSILNLQEFKLKECSYYLKDKGSIIIILK